MERIRQTIERFHMLTPGDHVLIGVSGGPDSVALLHWLYQQKEKYKIQLYVVHVNHQLREEAAEEAAYVKNLASSMGLPFRLFSVEVRTIAKENGWSLEQAGHEERFSCFRKMMQEWSITKLALGHHRDDRTESVVMHLLQGCGLDGLVAMPPRDGFLIRPLAEIGKQDLIRYCKKNALRYYVDATNLEADCLRNWVRLKLLPQLQQKNPRIGEAILHLQDSCQAELEYIQQQVEQLWERYGQKKATAVQFPAQVLREQPVALQRRVFRTMYMELTGSQNLTFDQVERIRQIMLQKNGTQRYSLAGGVFFIRQYDWLFLRKENNTVVEEAYCYTWDTQETFYLSEKNAVFKVNWKMEEAKTKDAFLCVAVDADCIESSLVIRCRKAGDRVQPLGMVGHKTLKKFFIDQKVPADLRGTLPIVVSGSEIVWIPGYFIADSVKITKKTKRYCFLQYFQK